MSCMSLKTVNPHLKGILYAFQLNYVVILTLKKERQTGDFNTRVAARKIR